MHRRGDPLFSNVTTGAVTENGQVYLTVTFDSGIYFYTTNRSTGESTPDASAPTPTAAPIWTCAAGTT